MSVVALLFVAAVSAVIAKRIRFPYPIGPVVIVLGLSERIFLPHTHSNPEGLLSPCSSLLPSSS
jgi:hypothetical protein